MKVPLSWLREFVDIPAEPRQLGEDLTFVGLALEGLEGRGTDAVLDLDVTTNRVDCMNVYGVAREVSVLYGIPLRPPDVSFIEAGRPASESLDVAIEAPDLCPRFCARVLDVRLGPSPAWLRDRLEAVGVRPINNVVDLTNYVMLELGQPSHAFDLDRVPGGRLIVRWAREGDRLTTLDGVERSLSGRVGVVGGTEGPLGVAGIMGGASSEVSDQTRVVALEAAWWDPLSIRRASKALGLHTEASHRFERGADPEAPAAATARIAHLLGKIGAGTARPGLIDRHPAPRPQRTTVFRLERAAAMLGTSVPEGRAREILTGLGFGVKEQTGSWSVEVPSWRGDVSREADVVEEVGRHLGVDRIPSSVPPSRGAEGLRPAQAAARAVREALVGAGLTEVVNYAFVSDADAGTQAPPRLRLANPLSEEQAALRSSLVMPGLVGTLRANLRQGRRDLRVFEVGRVFGPTPKGPAEEARIGLLLAGAGATHWSGSPPPADFFDGKGVVELLAQRLGIGPFSFAADGAPAFLHPGKSAVLLLGGRPRGYVGVLHPDVAETWELRDDAVVAELELDVLTVVMPPPVRFRPLPRAPAVARDLSVVADESVAAAEIEARVREAAGELLKEVSIVKRYMGPPIPPGKASLTLSLVYQDPGRTLTGEEVQASVDHIVAALRAAGLEIRGE
jgi:phenylalanyl-tRNA synthetase beta chain